MGERTGKPRGRPRGAKNKRTVEREKHVEELAEKAADALGVDVFEGNAHALLMLTYKDKKQPLDIRLEAARAAISYETPKLASIVHKGDAKQPVIVAAMSAKTFETIARKVASEV
ncbi:MAG: hypothetical protein ACTHMO_12780 [Rhodanobacteraceae bacterium]